jgi:hypothetical protein
MTEVGRLNEDAGDDVWGDGAASVVEYPLEAE